MDLIVVWDCHTRRQVGAGIRDDGTVVQRGRYTIRGGELEGCYRGGTHLGWKLQVEKEETRLESSTNPTEQRTGLILRKLQVTLTRQVGSPKQSMNNEI